MVDTKLCELITQEVHLLRGRNAILQLKIVPWSADRGRYLCDEKKCCLWNKKCPFSHFAPYTL
jgi:hypothetical protein